MSELENGLPEPEFIARDPAAVTRNLVQQYQELSGKTLYPAQLERILIDLMAYRESLLREAIQDAAKLNLVRYSRAPMLDYLGENLGVQRLPAMPARTTVRITFVPAASHATVVPAGLIVQIGQVQFQTEVVVPVASGCSTVDVAVVCVTPGKSGNGFLPGQIQELAETSRRLAQENGLSIARIENLDTSSGGAEAEDDEHLRARILLAPEQFSNAGSSGAYRFHALSAHSDVLDVAVLGADLILQNGSLESRNGFPPGVVSLYPLTRQGLPSAAIKEAVLAACSASRVRPLTDYVQVFDPQVVDFNLRAELTLLRTAESGRALAQAQAAAQAFCERVQAKLGVDLIRTQIIQALHGYGVYALTLHEPIQDIVLTAQQWARCHAIDVRVVGTAEG